MIVTVADAPEAPEAPGAPLGNPKFNVYDVPLEVKVAVGLAPVLKVVIVPLLIVGTTLGASPVGPV